MFYGITLHWRGHGPHNLCRTNARPPLSGQEKERIEDQKISQKLPSGHAVTTTPGDEWVQGRPRPTQRARREARVIPSRSRSCSSRRSRPCRSEQQHRCPSQERSRQKATANNKNGPPQGPIKGDLYTFRGPQAPEQGKHVPEVGLEPGSSP